ncbi:hypothetical protein SESBI_32743 [Sesbania bispinosa]|nr:hypothetical protein SESBI_32743 [Sesbania bispinosa]
MDEEVALQHKKKEEMKMLHLMQLHQKEIAQKYKDEGSIVDILGGSTLSFSRCQDGNLTPDSPNKEHSPQNPSVQSPVVDAMNNSKEPPSSPPVARS